MLLRKGKFSLVLPVLFLVQSMAWAESDIAGNAGRVKFANGNVRIVSSGSEQLARKGSLLKEGDTIVTDTSGSAQLDMKDKGIISVRPDSQLQIVTYKMNPNGDGGRAIFSLLKGAFRSVTGLIGKRTPANYAVETPTATIGVRGTDHEPQFVPPSGWSGAPGRPAGTYDTVYSGRTVISTKGGKIEVNPGQTGYAPRQDAAPIQVSMSSMRQAAGNQKDASISTGFKRANVIKTDVDLTSSGTNAKTTSDVDLTSSGTSVPGSNSPSSLANDIIDKAKAGSSSPSSLANDIIDKAKAGSSSPSQPSFNGDLVGGGSTKPMSMSEAISPPTPKPVIKMMESLQPVPNQVREDLQVQRAMQTQKPVK